MGIGFGGSWEMRKDSAGEAGSFLFYKHPAAQAAARWAGQEGTHDVRKSGVCALSLFPGMDL